MEFVAGDKQHLILLKHTEFVGFRTSLVGGLHIKSEAQTDIAIQIIGWGTKIRDQHKVDFSLLFQSDCHYLHQGIP